MPQLTTPADEAAPGWSWCREAARSARAAEFGSAAVRTMRSRSVLGIIRARGPLVLLLYNAARERRLVWQSPHAFAVLEAPIGLRLHRARRGPWPLLLRMLDRHWESAVLAGPAAFLLVAAVGLALAVPDPLPATIAVLLALLHVAILLTAGVLGGAVWFFSTFGRRTTPSVNLGDRARAGTTWSISLCHQAEPRRAAELLRQASSRVSHLVTHEIQLAAGRLGGRVRRAEVEEDLVCSLDGVTSASMRRAVTLAATRERPYQDGENSVLMRTGTPPPGRELRAPDSGGFFFWYLAGLAAAVLVSATVVADMEAAACRSDCAGRPASFTLAVRWLAQRLLFSDPPHLSPGTDRAYALGFLISIASATGWMVFVVAIIRYRRVVDVAKGLKVKTMRSRLLILVVTPEERTAVIEAVAGVNGQGFTRQRAGSKTVLSLGFIGDVDFLLARSGQGSSPVTGSALTTAEVIDVVRPDYLIMIGICYGLEDQPFGDILVSRQLKVVAHRKLTDNGVAQSPTVEIGRGDMVTASHVLLDRLESAELDWQGAPVHYGLMLSEDVLYDSYAERDRLRKQHPDAIGGEMEGAGVYAAAARQHVPWVLVKGVVDHAAGKGDEAHAVAARNAADFVVHMVTVGGLDPHE
ncbi:hypothetical protein [Catellatospora sp. NPDC049609]|uniref:5'-methylthioadenosine/S-adenosylhomocysteine nucleosidase family protein n=1 Tax=Catellatospora sp. NPDC049609 TaxID=3155505 RepID=UPI003430A54A